MKRKSFVALSVITHMKPGEGYYEAKQRLDDLWKQGQHPAQVEQRQKKEKK